MTRAKITPSDLEGSYDVYIPKTGHTASIDKHYISKVKSKEVEEYGFAYVNQPKERFV